MTSRDVYFFGNACAFSSRKAGNVSVPTSVIGGLGAPWRPAILSGKNGGAWGLNEFLLIEDTGVWLRQSKTFIAGVLAISYGESRLFRLPLGRPMVGS